MAGAMHLVAAVDVAAVGAEDVEEEGVADVVAGAATSTLRRCNG